MDKTTRQQTSEKFYALYIRYITDSDKKIAKYKQMPPLFGFGHNWIVIYICAHIYMYLNICVYIFIYWRAHEPPFW